jgi:GT2 family glycosyltransferase
MDVAVINHNTCAQLRACLASVPTDWPGRVIVVDNASTDGSPAMVAREFPQVRLLANTDNPGYGAAANQALAASQAPYLLLLNSDTLLNPGTLPALSTYLAEHPQVAIVGPRLLNPDGSLQPSRYSFPTPLHVFLEESTLIRLIWSLPYVRELLPRTAAHDQSTPTDWVLGAALAIRRSAFEQVQGFDKSFFLYAEEIDLSYRLRAAGWQTHFTPRASLVHTGGASTGQRRAEMSVQYYRSLLHFYRQHYSSQRLAQVTLTMKTIVLFRWLRDSVRLWAQRERPQRLRLAENLTAWRSILRSPAPAPATQP